MPKAIINHIRSSLLAENSLGHHFSHIIGIEIRIGYLSRRGIVDGQVLDLATIIELRHCQPEQTQTVRQEIYIERLDKQNQAKSAISSLTLRGHPRSR